MKKPNKKIVIKTDNNEYIFENYRHFIYSNNAITVITECSNVYTLSNVIEISTID